MDHIVKATDEDEKGMAHIISIDGDKDNEILIQRIMRGHFVEWNKMAKVVSDRGEAGTLYDKIQKADEATKAEVIAILDGKVTEQIK
jgi:hypothetical protein